MAQRRKVVTARFARSCRTRTILGTAVLVSLNGCATFGGNVKGSFSCAAPDGVCAPSSSIDDRALAMIAGDGAATEASPNERGSERRPGGRAARTTAEGRLLPMGATDPRRTRERVLRIVFQPYIDGQGWLHEASAVHAVVQTGEWRQQALASATAIPDRNARIDPPVRVSLADAVERADPANAGVAGVDHDLPDPAAVAAARERAADPLRAIQSEVAARLAAPRNRDLRDRPTPDTAARALDRRVAGQPETPSTAYIGNPARNAAGGAGAGPSGTGARRADPTPVTARPPVRAGASQAGGSALDTTATAPHPDGKIPTRETVRAAGFPGQLPEEK